MTEHAKSFDELTRYIRVDSLAYLSIDGLYRATGQDSRHDVPQYCDACFTGEYPTTLTDRTDHLPQDHLAFLEKA